MKALLAILATALAVLFLAAAALAWRERTAAVAELEAGKAETKQLAAEVQALKKERDTLRDQTRALEKRAQAAESDLKSATARVAAAEAKAANPPGGIGGPSSARRADFPRAPGTQPGSMKSLAEMMKNPAMREMIKQQQIAQIDMHYGGLISRFGLDDAEKSNFKQLLAERMGIETEMGLRLMDEKLTPQEREAVAKQMADAKKAVDEKIKTFLNSDEDYSAWQQWEATKQHRTQIELGRSLFADSPLTPQQEESLVDSMQRASLMTANDPSLPKPGANPGQLSQETVERQIANYDRQAQAILAEAGAYMNPQQLQALKTMQKQWRDMMEAGMKMSVMMYGKDKK